MTRVYAEANQDTKEALLHLIHDASCIVAQIISNNKNKTN